MRLAGIQALLLTVGLVGCSGAPDSPPATLTPAEPQPAAAPTPIPLIVTGVVALGEDFGPRRVVTVELHGQEVRQRLLPLVESMVAVSDTIREQQNALLTLRDQLGLAKLQAAEKQRLEAEIAELTSKGRPALEQHLLAQRALAYYANARQEFLRLGPNRMPLRDPITGAEIVLNAHRGQKENSLFLLTQAEAPHKATAERTEQALTRLQERDRVLRAELAVVDESLHDLNVEERRTRFVEIFLDMRQRARLLAEAEAMILRARDNSRALGVALSNEQGVYRLESGTPVEGVLVVAHTTELPGREGRPSMQRLLWIVPVDGMTLPLVSHTLTEANAALRAPVEVLQAWGQRMNETDDALRPEVEAYISSYPQPSGGDRAWIEVVLR